MNGKLYADLARTVAARLNCIAKGNDEWETRHEAQIVEWVKEFMPSGSGFDSGTKIDLDASTGDKLVFTTSFHHMNEGGCYDGWTEHVVTVTPSLGHGFHLKIGGRNRNEIKEHIHEIFWGTLDSEEHNKVGTGSPVTINT